MKYTVNNTAVEHFTITNPDRIKSLLFGVNKFQGFEESHETFESFKNFIADELILMNWDEYPIQFIPSDELDFFLSRYSHDHELIYVAEIDTTKISESDFNEAYNK